MFLAEADTFEKAKAFDELASVFKKSGLNQDRITELEAKCAKLEQRVEYYEKDSQEANSRYHEIRDECIELHKQVGRLQYENAALKATQKDATRNEATQKEAKQQDEVKQDEATQKDEEERVHEEVMRHLYGPGGAYDPALLSVMVSMGR